MDFLSNFFQFEYYTPYQRNVVKALAFCYTPCYCALYLYERGFRFADLTSRLMFAATLDILLISFSMCFLYAAQRGTRTKFGNELFMLVSPPVAFLTYILTSPDMYGGGLFPHIFTCVTTYSLFYVPFVLFGCAMMLIIKFRNLKKKIHPKDRADKERDDVREDEV